MSRKFVNYNIVEPDYFLLGSTNLNPINEQYQNNLWLANDVDTTGFYSFADIPKPKTSCNSKMSCNIPRPYDGNYFTTSDYNCTLNVNQPQNKYGIIRNPLQISNPSTSVPKQTILDDKSVTMEQFKNVNEITMPLEGDTTSNPAIKKSYGPAPFYKNIYQNNRNCHGKCDELYPVNRSDRQIRRKTVQNQVCHNMCCTGGPQLHKMVTTGWYELPL
jgi:hypothetical protein